MNIENNILKHYLKKVYFITGTAYASKSTTEKMFAERYDLLLCGENDHSKVSDLVATPEAQPDISYLNISRCAAVGFGEGGSFSVEKSGKNSG